MVINVGRNYFFHLLTTRMGTVYIMLQCMVWSCFQLSLVICTSLVKFGELVNPNVWLLAFNNEFNRCFHQFNSPILATNFSQFEQLKKKTKFLLVQNRCFSQFASWKRNHNKYRIVASRSTSRLVTPHVTNWIKFN